MSSLIRSQLCIVGVMLCCGVVTGLISTALDCLSAGRCGGARLAVNVVKITAVVFLTSDFLMFCDSGKVSAVSICSILVGLWLWERKICGIIYGYKERKGHGEKNGKTKEAR